MTRMTQLQDLGLLDLSVPEVSRPAPRGLRRAKSCRRRAAAPAAPAFMFPEPAALPCRGLPGPARAALRLSGPGLLTAG